MENELLRDFLRSVGRRKEVKPSFKYAVIHRHRKRYPVKEMCHFFEVSRSGYYKYLKQLEHPAEHPAKNFELAEKIRTKQEACRRAYGYRRIKLWLDSEGITKNQKQFYESCTDTIF